MFAMLGVTKKRIYLLFFFKGSTASTTDDYFFSASIGNHPQPLFENITS